MLYAWVEVPGQVIIANFQNSVRVHVGSTNCGVTSLSATSDRNQARFYVGAGAVPPKPELPPNLWLPQQYAVTPTNSYTGGVLEGWSGYLVGLVF